MGDNTGISWTDATWNPVRGCSRVSEGCRHCYAERVAARFSGTGQPYEGLAKMYTPSESVQDLELQARSGRTKSTPRWTGEVRFVADHLADPLRWKKPRRIFVNSMSDLFHEKLTNEQIAAVFGVMAACPQHTFQVLTKRSKRMREWFAWVEGFASADAEEWSGRECEVSIHDARRDCILEFLDETACAALAGRFDACHLGVTTNRQRAWPLPNVWIGVSVENCDALDRLDDLRACPAAVRFVSFEPLLEYLGHVDLTGIGWAIVGCESGPGARECSVRWLESLRDRCESSGVPFFLKQARCGCDPCDEFCPIKAGAGSKRKAGGVIELPYLYGVKHAAFPGVE